MFAIASKLNSAVDALGTIAPIVWIYHLAFAKRYTRLEILKDF